MHSHALSKTMLVCLFVGWLVIQSVSCYYKGVIFGLQDANVSSTRTINFPFIDLTIHYNVIQPIKTAAIHISKEPILMAALHKT